MAERNQWAEMAAAAAAEAKRQASEATRRDGLFTTLRAAEALAISPAQFRRIAAKRQIAPDKTASNPHNPSGPPMLLWSAKTIGRIRRTKDVATAKVRKRAPVDWSLRIRERYPTAADALADAAAAMFALNRYTRHDSCAERHRDEILDLKSRFVTMLYRAERFTDRVEAIRRTLPAKLCYGCDGLGCERCNGTGDYLAARVVFSYAFYFTIEGEKYCWIEPDFAIGFTPKVEETRKDSGPRPRELDTTVDMPRRRFAEAKALIRFACEYVVEPFDEAAIAADSGEEERT